MNLEKAIEILSDSAHRGMTTFNEDYKDAQKLGIKALIYLRHARQDGAHHAPALLEGETPDGESL